MIKAIRTIIRSIWAPLGVFVANFTLVGLGWYPDGLDNLFHFLGGAAIAWFFLHVVAVLDDWLERPGHRARALLAVGFAAMAAIFWELAELMVDPYLAIAMQPSIADTVTDLVLGVLGAIALVTVDSLRHGRVEAWVPAATSETDPDRSTS